MARGGGRKRQLTAAATVASLAAVLASTLVGVSPAATSRGKADTLRAKQATLARSQRAVLLDLYALETRLGRARATLHDLGSRSNALERARMTTRHRAAAVRHSLASAQRQLARTLRTVYAQGQPDPVAILLGATSIDQAVTGLDDLSRAAKANRRLIATLRTKELRLRGLDRRLRAQTRNLRAARRNAETALLVLERTSTTRAERLASLRAHADLTGKQVARLDALARQAQRRSERLVAPAAEVAPLSTSAPDPPATVVTPRLGTRTMVVDAVAYHLPGHTASGLPVGPGVVAVDPSVIPLGTRIFVPGYGKAVAADIGSAVRGNIIDLWMPSRAEALAWGRRTVTITVYG